MIQFGPLKQSIFNISLTFNFLEGNTCLHKLNEQQLLRNEVITHYRNHYTRLFAFDENSVHYDFLKRRGFCIRYTYFNNNTTDQKHHLFPKFSESFDPYYNCNLSFNQCFCGSVETLTNS